MTGFIYRLIKQVASVAMLMTFTITVANAGDSKDSILNEYETHGFECLDISQTINEDTLKSYTDLAFLENSDNVHVCVRVDLAQMQFAGNKYVFVFDQDNNMKTYNQIASVLD